MVVHGFSRSLGSWSVLNLELWALHDSLNHAWRLGYRQFKVEVDNLEVSKIVHRKFEALASLSLVTSIHELCSQEWGITIRHIDSGANVVADKMASVTHNLPVGETIYDALPYFVIILLDHDMAMIT
ncbi:hypothetical protein GQ457_03G013830 [Hibiscus cannabinus]